MECNNDSDIWRYIGLFGVLLPIVRGHGMRYADLFDEPPLTMSLTLPYTLCYCPLALLVSHLTEQESLRGLVRQETRQERG